ncbi:MAG: PAS domain-containing sensor histidine kinase [bacterium]|nr:PAS domain-containing sensor histidine kinase [bacterium]
MDLDKGWSKELLYQLVDNVKDYAIFVLDPKGEIVTWNIGAERLFGYSSQEAIGRKCDFLFTPEDRASNIPEREMATSFRDGVASDERWHMRKDGARFFASGLQTPLYDDADEHTGFAKIARDLTERVEAQQELLATLESIEARVLERTNDLKLSNESLRLEIGKRRESERLRAALLHKIVQTQENERRRIARDIHDHVGQSMTALVLRLGSLMEKYREHPSVSGDLSGLTAIAHQIDSEVDFLAWELRPSVLDDLGLAPAIERYVDDWSQQFRTPAEFIKVGTNGRHMTSDYEINLYRIVQEALNNTAKHAAATRASVVLELHDSQLTLIVEDDGKGFEVTEAAVMTGNGRGMGLLGMQERAELFGGEVEIESAPGSGTTVYVRVPVMFDESSGLDSAVTGE